MTFHEVEVQSVTRDRSAHSTLSSDNVRVVATHSLDECGIEWVMPTKDAPNVGDLFVVEVHPKGSYAAAQASPVVLTADDEQKVADLLDREPDPATEVKPATLDPAKVRPGGMIGEKLPGNDVPLGYGVSPDAPITYPRETLAEKKAREAGE